MAWLKNIPLTILGIPNEICSSILRPTSKDNPVGENSSCGPAAHGPGPVCQVDGVGQLPRGPSRMSGCGMPSTTKTIMSVGYNFNMGPFSKKPHT